MRLPPRLLLATAALAFAPLAHAVPVTLDFTAKIYFVDSGFTDVSVDQLITGSVTYESSTPDPLSGNPTVGAYANAATAVQVSVGGFTGSQNGTGSTFNIYDGFVVGGSNPIDGFEFGAQLSGNVVNSLSLVSVNWALYSADTPVPSSAFTSDALPASGAGWPGVDLFAYNNLVLIFASSDGEIAFRTEANLTSLTASGVPDGGAVGGLLALALGGLALARRRV